MIPACSRCGVKEHLRELVLGIEEFLELLDKEMANPASEGRGQRIALLTNKLSYARERAKYFGCGYDYRTKKWPKPIQGCPGCPNEPKLNP